MIIRLRGRICRLQHIAPYVFAIFVIPFILVVLPCLILIHHLDLKWSFYTNYLTPPNDHFYTGDFLVDNSKCRIPNITIFHKHTMELLKDQSYSCNWGGFQDEAGFDEFFKGLTFVRNEALIFDERVLHPFGLDLKEIDCCYHVVERVGRQDKQFFTKILDDQYKYSQKCYPVHGPEAFPRQGFIRVTCHQPGFEYRAFHLLAVVPNETGSRPSPLSRKLEYWKARKQENPLSPPVPPMNILLIGLDSMSLMHFRRMLQSTTSLLEKELNAFEMKGFTKVGENTIANFVPLMTSLFAEELKEACFINRFKTPFDGCPFLWKNFLKRNYLTAHIEDAPSISIFNYWKGGFDKEPVDFYPRAWMLAAYAERNGSKCITGQRPDQLILQYTQDLMALAKSRNIPFFITTWLTELTHNSMSGSSVMDTTLEHTLLSMKLQGLLENTLLLVMSDHGYRYLKIRRTLTGYYEDKLPALWIRLPEKNLGLGIELEKMKIALEHNSRQLVTPFDIHATLKDILNLKNDKATTDKPGSRGF